MPTASRTAAMRPERVRGGPGMGQRGLGILVEEFAGRDQVRATMSAVLRSRVVSSRRISGASCLASMSGGDHAARRALSARRPVGPGSRLCAAGPSPGPIAWRGAVAPLVRRRRLARTPPSPALLALSCRPRTSFVSHRAKDTGNANVGNSAIGQFHESNS